MKIGSIKIAGREVTAIYNCGEYVFYSNYYGVIGIAERTAINEWNEPIIGSQQARNTQSGAA